MESGKIPLDNHAPWVHIKTMEKLLPVWAWCRQCAGRTFTSARVNGKLQRMIFREDAPGMTMIPYVAWIGDVAQPAPKLGNVEDAVPISAWCVRHRDPLTAKAIRVVYSDTPCERACETATGSDCKCSCGGVAHGVRA